MDMGMDMDMDTNVDMDMDIGMHMGMGKCIWVSGRFWRLDRYIPRVSTSFVCL
jgi:hypothetical protein